MNEMEATIKPPTISRCILENGITAFTTPPLSETGEGIHTMWDSYDAFVQRHIQLLSRRLHSNVPLHNPGSEVRKQEDDTPYSKAILLVSGSRSKHWSIWASKWRWRWDLRTRVPGNHGWFEEVDRIRPVERGYGAWCTPPPSGFKTKAKPLGTELIDETVRPSPGEPGVHPQRWVAHQDDIHLCPMSYDSSFLLIPLITIIPRIKIS